jgi:hypothetical protein
MSPMFGVYPRNEKKNEKTVSKVVSSICSEYRRLMNGKLARISVDDLSKDVYYICEDKPPVLVDSSLIELIVTAFSIIMLDGKSPENFIT